MKRCTQGAVSRACNACPKVHLVARSRCRTTRPRIESKAISMGVQTRGTIARNVVGGLTTTHPGVSVVMENTSWSSRRIFASVPIQAAVDVVWDCLTDYKGLSSFIPSLVESRCLKRKHNGAVVYQVGAQDVAMGVKFSAACTLDCTEFPTGMPDTLCCKGGTGSDGLPPFPKHSLMSVPSRDIVFNSVGGDFSAFRGVWRMQPLQQSSRSPSSTATGTMLCYSLHVQPLAWLPVGVIQDRIGAGILSNMEAIQRHAEVLQRKQTKDVTQLRPTWPNK